MKKLLLALALLALSPAISSAQYWNSPQSNSGYTWLQGLSLNLCPKIYFEGPLYNYGPYNYGPGYEFQFVKNPHFGGYAPAYPSTYNGLPGNFPNQWQSINPGVPNYPFAPPYSNGAPRSPSDYYQGPGYPVGQQAPKQPIPVAAPAASPAAETAVDSTNAENSTAKTTSFRPLRNWLNRQN